MKSTVLRYGLYATLTIVILSWAVFFLLKNIGQGLQETAGYLTMLLSMIFIFLGIRYFRDRENGGYLSFGQGLKVGVLIVLIPAVAFGLFDILYTEVLNPTWKEDYYSKYIENLRQTVSADKLQAAIQKAEKQKDMFSNPVLQFLLMGGTVFILGFIVTIISSLALRRSRIAVA